MTEKELKRLRRTDLLELLLEQSRENEDLRRDLTQAQEQLKDQTSRMESAETLAETAQTLGSMIKDVQETFERYLETIRLQTQEAESAADPRCQLQERCDACIMYLNRLKKRAFCTFKRFICKLRKQKLILILPADNCRSAAAPTQCGRLASKRSEQSDGK